MAISLAKLGHTVYAGARTITTLDDIACERLIPLELDVNNEAHVDGAIAKISEQQHVLDILVNNAGYGAMGPLVEMPLEQLEDQFTTNVFSPLRLVQKFFPLLLKSDDAQIVNIGSVAGVTPTPFSGAYCASKSALHTLSEVLRMELKPFNIHVMTVYPGGVASDFGSNANSKLRDTLQKNSLYSRIVSAIESRAKISSGSPTTSQNFVDTLIPAVLKAKPADTIRIGHGSTLIPITRYFLPNRLREHLLCKTFELNTLDPIR